MIPESFMKEKRNFDNFISDKAKTLPRYVSPEKLWCKIESDLKALQKKKDIKRDFKWLNNLIRFDIKPVWRYAALAVSVTIILFFVLPRLLYEPDPLAEIEKAEKKYISAIERLAFKVEKQEPDIDMTMWVFYQERLDLLDESIKSCKNVIEKNNGSINARKYLLLAYHEKVSTLKKLLNKEKGQT